MGRTTAVVAVVLPDPTRPSPGPPSCRSGDVGPTRFVCAGAVPRSALSSVYSFSTKAQPGPKISGPTSLDSSVCFPHRVS